MASAPNAAIKSVPEKTPNNHEDGLPQLYRLPGRRSLGERNGHAGTIAPRPAVRATAPHAEYCLDANPWLTVKTLHLHVVADTLPGVHPCVIRPA